MHRYCISCLKDGVRQVKDDGHTYYYCDHCNKQNGRSLYFNTHTYWLDETKELWHESCGVYVRRKDGRFLFYMRTEFPRRLTVPAGHVDYGEAAAHAAKRELAEETGITGNIRHIGDTDIEGDSCSAGADAHKWHTFFLAIDGMGEDIEILDEGERPLWFTLDEAKEQGMAFVIGEISELYRLQLVE